MEKFIDFVIDLANEELSTYFDGNARTYFLQGGCLEFAKIIKRFIKRCEIVINKELNHCGILYQGKMYDAKGIIREINNFNIANREELEYMEQYFGIPEKQYINGIKISDYLINELKLCNIGSMVEIIESKDEGR